MLSTEPSAMYPLSLNVVFVDDPACPFELIKGKLLELEELVLPSQQQHEGAVRHSPTLSADHERRDNADPGQLGDFAS